MRLALIHDWLVTFGGAEKVAQTLLEIAPFDLYTLFYDKKKLQSSFFDQKKIQASYLQRCFGVGSYYRFLLPLFPLAIGSLDLSSYDLIVSSSHSLAKGFKKSLGQYHICYCHSPMRTLWDLEEFHLGRVPKAFRQIVAKEFARLRTFDQKSAQGVDQFIANSTEVARRIERHYKRESRVIFPPVDVEFFSQKYEVEDFYFTSCRFVPYKRLDLLIDAFIQLPTRRLVIAGDGPEKKRLQRRAGKNVTFVGWLPRQELRSYMGRARAFIHGGLEDFGIAMAEAQSSGAPVIAYGKGGAKDIVAHQKTGILFDEATKEGVIEGILEFEQGRWNRSEIQKSAGRFSKERFVREMKAVLGDVG